MHLIVYQSKSSNIPAIFRSSLVVALLGALARAVARLAVLECDGVAEVPLHADLALVARGVVEAAGAQPADVVARVRGGVVHVVVAEARPAEITCAMNAMRTFAVPRDAWSTEYEEVQKQSLF